MKWARLITHNMLVKFGYSYVLTVISYRCKEF
nr:MAG TPA: hypothetical protein [Microviridae sp.]